MPRTNDPQSILKSTKRSMTDREKFEQLMKDFGLVAKVEEDEPKESNEPKVYLQMKADHGNVDGYYGFVATWTFTNEGRFLSVWIGE